MPGIIQREHAGPVTALSLPDVEREAAHIVAGAEAQAKRILADAEARSRVAANAREAEAAKRGFATGRKEGLEHAQREARQAALTESRERINALAESLAAAIREYDAAKHRLLSEAESGLITLAIAIARRVCKTQVNAGSEPARANVAAVLQLVRHTGDLELHLNPAQCDQLAELAQAAAHELGKARHVRVVPDAAIAAGGCRVVGGDGSIDAQIETQLDRIAAALCHAAIDTPSTGGPA